MSVSKSSDDAHLLIGRALGNTYRRVNPSPNGSAVPPDFAITDTDGSQWTLGSQYNPQIYGGPARRGDLEFNILRNDVDVGEFASRITMENGITIYGRAGRRRFSRRRNCFI